MSLPPFYPALKDRAKLMRPLRGGDKWLGLSVPIRVDLWLMIGFQPPNALVNQMLSVL
jgi:hypothetical protein